MTDRLVILAAGSSTRMSRSLGATPCARMTKCMIPVGEGGRPFLEYLLNNAENAGFRETVLVTAPGDSSIEEYFGDSFREMELSRVVQTVPPGRTKPASTADALLQVLRARPWWTGSSFCVCNSDNLYSTCVFEKVRETATSNAMPCYHRDGLEYPADRTCRFAVVKVSDDFDVLGLIEKPTISQVEECSVNGDVLVSMNLFKLDYEGAVTALEKVQYNPVRNEKELPCAVELMIRSSAGCMEGFPVCCHVPDLTSAGDIEEVSRELSAGNNRERCFD